MRADKYLTLTGKKAIVVGSDNRLPALDATDLINIDKSLLGKIVEVTNVMPSSFTSNDIGRYLLYSGETGLYESGIIYRVVYDLGTYKIERVSASADIEGLPKVSSSDNGKSLVVVNGVWVLINSPISATSQNVKNALGMSGSGVISKVINQRGNFVDLPVVINYTGGTGIDISGNIVSVVNDDIKSIIGIEGISTSKVLSKSGAYVDLPTLPSDNDIRSIIGIKQDGSESKVLTEKGSYVSLSNELSENDIKSAIGIDEISGSSDKYLTQDGAWAEISASIDMSDVKEGLGIDDDGDESKALSQKGTWVNLPTDTDIKTAIGIKENGSDSKVLTEKGNWIVLPSGGDLSIEVVKEGLGIDEESGSKNKYLSESGTMEELPEGGGLTQAQVISLILIFG